MRSGAFFIGQQSVRVTSPSAAAKKFRIPQRTLHFRKVLAGV
jgi:hypothetical protein